MIILISYDLNNHERPSSYAIVEKMIKEQSDSWAKPLYSQWFVDTEDSLSVWQDRMKSVTDANDRWFITKVTSIHRGWLSKGVWDWLNVRI